MESRATTSHYPHVVRDERIAGGQPLVEGTRIPVATVVRAHQLGMDFDEILTNHPSLTPAGLHGAFVYYFDHQDEVDRLLAEADEPPDGFEIVDS